MLFRALSIGINAYPTMPLHNCVNDSEDFAMLLEKYFGYQRKNGGEVRLLCDGRATASNIMERIRWLADADVRVLFQSGHGAQIADREGDELDRLDELFCPVDFDWGDRDTMLVDDDYALLFSYGPKDAVTVFISDSCHSGDLAKTVRTGVWRGQPKAMPVPPDIAWRNRQAMEAGLPMRALVANMPRRVVGISACASDQVAMDGSPENGRGNGAFAWAFMKQLRADPVTPLDQAVAAANRLLSTHGYEQVAQIAGPDDLVSRPLPRKAG